MTFVAGLLTLLIIGIIRGSPNSPVGRALRVYLVEKPVSAALRIERHHQIWLGLIAIAVLLLTAFAAGKFATLFETDFLFAYSLDLSLYLDAVLVASAIAAASRLRTLTVIMRSRIGRWRGVGAAHKRLARPRARSRRPAVRRPDNDEDGPFFAALAA